MQMANITNSNGVGYNLRQVSVHASNGHVVDINNDLGVFINGNSYNVHWRHRVQQLQGTVNLETLTFDTLPTEFAGLFPHDIVDETQSPMLIYSLGGNMVAWYDMERFLGYIAD